MKHYSVLFPSPVCIWCWTWSALSYCISHNACLFVEATDPIITLLKCSFLNIKHVEWTLSSHLLLSAHPSTAHKSAAVSVRLHTASPSHLCARLLSDTCPQSKGWLNSLMRSFSIKLDLHHTRTWAGEGAGGGALGQRQNQNCYYCTAVKRERMKGCEGMQLFKQLFDLVVTSPSVTHPGSNTVEISQTFIPLVWWFSALFRPQCVCDTIEMFPIVWQFPWTSWLGLIW